MYSIMGDGVMIYSDVSPTESRKADSPKLTLKDNAAGSLEITLPPGNAGYDILKRMTSEIIVYRDKQELWRGRILSEKMNFWNNRTLTCEGELSYLNDTIQPQAKYPEGTTVGSFLTSVLDNHNKRYGDDEERYKFYIDEAYIYNYNEPFAEEIVTDYGKTLDAINENVVNAFECHLCIKRIGDKKYISLIKEEYQLNENSQIIRFGDNLLDFTKNWDLTDLATVLIPRGATVEQESTEDSDAFDTYVTLSDIPKGDVVDKEEIGYYERDKDGKLTHNEDGNLIYIYPDKKDENGNLVYKYKVDKNGYITIESKTLDNSVTVPTIRVDTKTNKKDTVMVEFLDYSTDSDNKVTFTITAKIETDGTYANVYLKNENEEFYCLKDIYGRVEAVADFSEAKDSIELLKKTRDYIKEHQFDQMTLEVSAVDLRYLSNINEPVKILDRIRCISYPHGMNTLFTVTELSIELDKPDSAKYTLEKTLLNTSGTSSLSETMSSVSSEIESPHSTILKNAQANADKMLRENTNGYVSLITNNQNGQHSEALVVSSGKDYTRSEHFWIWNVNGLGHYTEYANQDAPQGDADDKTDTFWNNGKPYKLNLGITMDGAIVANRITVGHMSADRVRTGVLMSQDGNVVWNLNKGGSMVIKKGSIDLGNSSFSVNDNGELRAVKGYIGGFVIEADNLHNDCITLDKSGLVLVNEKTNVGKIGTTQWENEPSKKILSMSLEPDGAAIVWGYKEKYTDENYTAQFIYAAKDYGQYKAGNFYMHGNLDLRGRELKNFVINPSTADKENNNIVVNSYTSDGNVLLVKPGFITSEGTIDYTKTVSVKIQNGFVINR